MSYAALVVLTAVLFLRPEELYPEIAGTRLYLIAMTTALWSAAPGVVRQLHPTALRWQPVTAGVVGLLVAGVLSHLARGQLGLATGFGGEFGKVVLFYLVLVAVLNTRERLDAYLGWLVVLVLGVSMLSLLQHHEFIDVEALRPIEQVDFDADTNEVVRYPRLRGSGIFNDPNDLCLILAIGACCSLYRVFRAPGPTFRPVWLLPIGVFLYALALTKSRGGMLAVGAAVTAFLITRFGWRRALPAVALLVPAAGAVFAGRQTNIELGEGTGQERILLWSDGLDLLFRKNPVTGIGAGEYAEELEQVAHNSFVHAYVETGLVGGTVFLATFLAAVAVLWQSAGRRGGLGAYLLALTVGYMAGMGSLSRNYVLPTFLVLGLVTSYLNTSHKEPPDWYVVDARLMRRAAVLGVAGLIGAKVFVMLFANYRGG